MHMEFRVKVIDSAMWRNARTNHLTKNAIYALAICFLFLDISGQQPNKIQWK